MASLAVFQLLIIKEKKKLQDNWNHTLYNNSSDSNTANNLLRLDQTLHWGSCFMSQYNRMCWTYCRYNKIFVNYCLVSNHWLRTLCLYCGGNDSLGSCAIFKSNYVGQNSGWNRRIVAMPLVMPVIVYCFSNQYCNISRLHIWLWILLHFEPLCLIPLVATRIHH